jgi:hypothetical protein
MTKILSILFFTLAFAKGCNGESKQDLESAVIEYVANTRGFYQKIVIQNNTVSVSRDRDGKDNPKPEKLSEADKKELLAGFQDIELEDMPNLKAPTEKRFYDGAAIALIKITYKGKTYESVHFDHGNPPVEIEKLVTKVTSYGKR